MIDSMGAARRFASARLAAFVVCAGGVLLAVPTAGLAADWTSSSESVTGSSGASSVVTGLDNSSNLTAVWADSAGIETNVRTAAGASWGSASSVSVDAGATAPDFAESLGTQLATWVGSDGNVHAATGSGSLGTGSLPLTTSGAASSPQAAIVSGVPTVFWIEGNTIESSAWNGLAWSTPASPLSAPLAAGTISDLRVSIVGYGWSCGLAPRRRGTSSTRR